MILQALAEYYQTLSRQGKIAKPGWNPIKVSFALDLDDDGRPSQLFPLNEFEERKGKQVQVPRTIVMPAHVKRTSGKSANFLCDNALYVFGLPKESKKDSDESKNIQDAKECFSCMANYHLQMLEKCDEPAGIALKKWFDNGKPMSEEIQAFIEPYRKELLAGANITYSHHGTLVADNPQIGKIWDDAYDVAEDGEKSICLISGEKAVPESVHPSIKGVAGASTMGAAIVSFNAPSFCSYGKEQSLNAPVSKASAFAYTSALNYLLSDSSHRTVIGDSTIVYWADNGDPAYQDMFNFCLNGSNDAITDNDLKHLFTKLSLGEPVDFDGTTLSPSMPFYILALSPNNARLSVRFFLNSTFGEIAANMKSHADRLEIIDGPSNFPVWRMLRETVRNAGEKSASPLPQLSGDIIRSILTGTPYPSTLYQQVQLRIRAEHDISRGKASIIKAYLLRNSNNPNNQEVLRVKLNEETTYTPYVLGELFSVLENVQETASGVSTIKDHYFTSACQTPAVVFPRLIDLAQKHLRKMEQGKRVFFSKQIQDLIGKLDSDFPIQLNLNDQGIFQIGYYHKTRARYAKKEQ